MTVSKAYHCAYTIHYHIVFPVKYRKALLSEAVTLFIKEIAKEIAERYFIEIEQLGCDTNHIHLLCGAHPKYAPGALVRVFKSVTAKKVFEQFPLIKKELWGG
ncbi:IS200/IS605 family transposase, partial [Candidatus Roizmanbacteria bacterium]|nr:IS200/IS605 family transposase [Candidatus Roizmanbacteria bacterium]